MAWFRPESWLQSFQFALFFLFTAVNLAWFALRNVAIAVDEYVYFEGLEVARRFLRDFRDRRACCSSCRSLRF